MDAQNVMPAPQDLGAEQSVVGSLMLDRDAILKVAPFLKGSDFFSEECGRVYEAIRTMYERRVPADLVTLYHELGKSGAIDRDQAIRFITDVVTRTPTACHVEYYAKIVVELAVRRALIQTGGRIAGMGYEADKNLADLLSRAQSSLGELTERGGPDGYATAEQMAGELLDRLDYLDTAAGALTGVPTGFPRLDDFTGGLQASDLIVVGARTGIGKTSLCMSIASHVLGAARPSGGQYSVGVFSLEMPRIQLTQRITGLRTGVNTQKLRLGRQLTDDEHRKISDAAAVLSEQNFVVDDRANLTIGELRARAVRMKDEQGLDLLIVDYLQLVKAPRKESNRAQEVGEVARGLKELARELNVPVLAPAQLNREVENRPVKSRVPQLSDLRESGEIEQAADIVILLHREDVYDTETDRDGIADLHIKKHRNGATGIVSLWFDPTTTKFSNLAFGRTEPTPIRKNYNDMDF